MKIFISDLHLGDGSRTDDFHRDRELLQFLEFVQAQARELIILGDLFELWQADLDRVLFCHSEVMNRLFSLRNKVKLTYVIGNHDYIPFIKFVAAGVGISLEYRDSENGIVAEHGHQYDRFNRYRNPLKVIKSPPGKYLNAFIGELERFIHPDADLWVKKAMAKMDDFLQEAILIRNKVTPTTKEYLRRGGHYEEFEQAAKKHMQGGAKVVLFGHTHIAQLQKLEKGIYVDCGAWVDDVDPTYVACDRDKVELKKALTHKVIKQLCARSSAG